MPLYEYKCSKCEKVHEVIQKFSDAPLETCPECGGEVSKLMSRSSFALQGSGWYTSDYKRSKPAAAPTAAAPATPAPAAAAPASSEASKSST